MLEKTERIRAIADAKPPLEGEDADYIEFSLLEFSTAQIFFKHAKLPGWISWLEKRHFLEPLFNRQAEVGDFHRALGLWLIETFLDEHSPALMASIQRNKGKLHPYFCWCIWRHFPVRNSNIASNANFARWVAILLAQARDVLTDDNWCNLLNTCRFPDDKTTSVLLFDFVTKPEISLKENWGALSTNADEYQKVRFELNLEKHREHRISEAWRNLIKPNFSAYANELEPIVINNLRAAHALLQIGERGTLYYDPFSIHRQSIRSANQNSYRTVIDILIDAGIEIVNDRFKRDANHLSALSQQCIESDSPILRRIGIYGFGKREDISADDKLRWLVKNDLLYHFKTDVFQFLEGSYPQATPAARQELIQEVLQGPKGEPFTDLSPEIRNYEIFNFLVWLRRVAPHCTVTNAAYKCLKDEYPQFGEREHPELDYHSTGVQSYNPAEGFNFDSIASQPPDAFLDEMLACKPKTPFERSRSSYCSAIASVVPINPEWGISWVQMLLAKHLTDADLWRCVCQGWRNANLTPVQWKLVFDLAETIEAPTAFFSSFTEVLENGARREQHAIPDAMMGQAHGIATRIWHLALSTTLPSENSCGDWLTSALNEPGGRLAEFWLQRISVARRIAGDSWQGLPNTIKDALSIILAAQSGSATSARILFASQFHYFFSLDAPFAREKLLPFFNWQANELTAEQCWDGFLFWGRWYRDYTEQLLPYFNDTISRVTRFPKETREHLINHITGVALFQIEDPLENGWLPSVLQKLEDNDRQQVAERIDTFLNETDILVTEKIWERWFGKFWKMRLRGKPTPLLAKEAREMICWSCSFGKHYSEAVSLATTMGEMVDCEQSDIFYRINEKGVAKTAPSATADLALFYLKTKPKFFYFADHARTVWSDLKTGGVSQQKLLEIRNAFLALGCDPESPGP